MNCTIHEYQVNLDTLRKV